MIASVLIFFLAVLITVSFVGPAEYAENRGVANAGEEKFLKCGGVLAAQQKLR
jgi:hypothetical protein